MDTQASRVEEDNARPLLSELRKMRDDVANSRGGRYIGITDEDLDYMPDKVVKMLDAGMNPNWTDSSGSSPLKSVAISGKWKILELMLNKYGGDINVKGGFNHTPLYQVVLAANKTKVEKVLGYGGDPSTIFSGLTVYEMAVLCKNGYYSLFSPCSPPPSNEKYQEVINVLKDVTPKNITELSVDEMLERSVAYQNTKHLYSNRR